MDRDSFEALPLAEIVEQAKVEGPARAGKPEYFDRPWSQLRDEMTRAGCETIGELDPARVDVFFHSTGAVYADVGKLLGLGDPEE